ncbi:MAG: class I SAM-dependent methyltransferase [Kiloniellaceae bacterium]
MYYGDKLHILKDVFGADTVALQGRSLEVDGASYPIVDDVIVLLAPSQYPPSLRQRLQTRQSGDGTGPKDFARDIQFTFGEEWQEFPEIMPEHEIEFRQYFDLVDIEALADKRVCDLGCGIGRWSYFLHGRVQELVLVDFSEAIFVARRNLGDASNAVFLMGDLQRLPFRKNFADLIFCLGVLHHLPSNALDAVRNIGAYAPQLLIYLYSALDSRPVYYRALLPVVSMIRNAVCQIESPRLRAGFAWAGTVFLYTPMIRLGDLLEPFGLSKYVPLHDFYHGKTHRRIRQDVYDRFFTRIEQRFSRSQIMGLSDSFGKLTISDQIPFWHFLCER